MKRIKVICVILLSVCYVLLTGTPSMCANGWYANIKITLIAVHSGYYLIETDSELADCTAKGRFVIKGDAVMAKEMYAMAMAAFLSGKPVNIYVDAAQGCLNNGMVSILLSIHN